MLPWVDRGEYRHKVVVITYIQHIINFPADCRSSLKGILRAFRSLTFRQSRILFIQLKKCVVMQKNNEIEYGYYQLVASLEGEKLTLSKSICREMLQRERHALGLRYREALGNPRAQHAASCAYERLGDLWWEQSEFDEAWQCYRKALYYTLSKPAVRQVGSRVLRYRFEQLEQKVATSLQGHPELLQAFLEDATLRYARSAGPTLWEGSRLGDERTAC